jgi:cytochrome c oxidase subunit 2
VLENNVIKIKNVNDITTVLTEDGFAHKWQINFQNPATQTMERIIDLHHDIMFFVFAIVTFVLYILIKIIKHFAIRSEYNALNVKRYRFEHHTNIERIWTYIPTFILLLIASPSFSLLYSIDELHDPEITLKVIGHQ